MIKYKLEEYRTILVGTNAYNAPSYLPVDLDNTGFIDLTCIGDRFRVFFDPRTGRTHDGNIYYKEHMKELRNDN